MVRFRIWPVFFLVFAAQVLPLVIAGIYGVWRERSGRVLDEFDGLAIGLVTICALFVVGRGIRHLIRRDPLTDRDFLLGLAVFAGLSFDPVMKSPNPAAVAFWMLAYVLAIWLGARQPAPEAGPHRASALEQAAPNSASPLRRDARNP